MTSSNDKATPEVKYIRNMDHIDQMSPEDLMSERLSDMYLYSQIHVGQLGAEFFTRSALGAYFDRKLRGTFGTAFSALLEASPGDASAVADAQAECRAVIMVYDLVASAIAEGQSAKQQLDAADDINEDQPGE